MASRIRTGVSGRSCTSAPMARSASFTALRIAAGGPTAPPSPIPLTPNSVCGDGVCMCNTRMGGNELTHVADLVDGENWLAAMLETAQRSCRRN